MKAVIIGGNGQLGSDLVNVFHDDAISLTHKEIEVTDVKSCEKLLGLKPDVVINCAAFHKVDACEEDPLKTFQVNSIGARNIAMICKQIDAVNVYISTDYVFDGTKGSPYVETDIINPINVYGVSKVAGELFTKNISPKYYIIRVASLFGETGASGKGSNFVETMIQKAKAGENVKVIDDVFMSPTYTLDCANIIHDILSKNLTCDIYHAVNDGFCNWYEFASKIFSLLDININVGKIKAKDLNMKAARPPNSSLSIKKIKSFSIKTNTWENALKRYLTKKGHLKEKIKIS